MDSVTDGECIGRIGTGGCHHAPVVLIGGDPACVYHVTTVIHLRLRETHKPIKVSVLAGGPWEERHG